MRHFILATPELLSAKFASRQRHFRHHHHVVSSCMCLELLPRIKYPIALSTRGDWPICLARASDVQLAQCGITKNFATIGAGSLAGRLEIKAMNFNMFPRVGAVVEDFLANFADCSSTFKLK
jgi:hypothetical protein